MIDPRAGDPPAPVKLYVEVTDTISIPYTTGIQRVVREIVSRLDTDNFPDIDVVPVFRPAPQLDYRRLTEPELRALREHPAGGTAGRRADKFGPLAPLARVVGDIGLVYRSRLAYRHLRARLRERRARGADLALGPMEAGSVFLDIEGSWFDPEPRRSLLPRLRSQGVQIVVVVHDVMPVLFPEWFDSRQIRAFSEWLDAHIANSQLFLTNSTCTRDDLARLAIEKGIDLSGRVHRIILGADFAHGVPEPIALNPAIGRYLLVVGTIEPRKNHRLALDAWDRLRVEYPDLGMVLVGKEGWMVEGIVDEIRSHEEFNKRLLWLGGIADTELLWLYRNAFLSLAPSHYEGLGVPVIEALTNGCPTIASTGGALPEAGQGFAELVDPGSVDDLVELIRTHLDDTGHHQQKVRLAESYDPPTWEQAAVQVAEAIRSVVHNATHE